MSLPSTLALLMTYVALNFLIALALFFVMEVMYFHIATL